jgi:hypothetical protein
MLSWLKIVFEARRSAECEITLQLRHFRFFEGGFPDEKVAFAAVQESLTHPQLMMRFHECSKKPNISEGRHHLHRLQI